MKSARGSNLKIIKGKLKSLLINLFLYNIYVHFHHSNCYLLFILPKLTEFGPVGQFTWSICQILAKLGQIFVKLWNLLAKLLKLPAIFEQLTSNFRPTPACFPNIGGRGTSHGGTPAYSPLRIYFVVYFERS